LNLSTGEIPAYSESRGEFITSDNIVHTINFDEAMDQLKIHPENKTYYIYTSCNFTDSGEITEKDTMDAISLTIDQKPPMTNIFDVINNVELPYTDQLFTFLWKNQRTLRLRCSDIQDHSTKWFGCSKINYCIVSGASYNTSLDYFVTDRTICQGNTFTSIQNNQTDIALSSSFKQGYRLCDGCNIAYYSEDNGGNKPIHWTIVDPRVRDMGFIRPQLIIKGSVEETDVVIYPNWP
jgi:hypothetical protein